MNMLRQDLQTFLLILSPLEVLHPFPILSSPTILRTTKGKSVTFLETVLCLVPEELSLREGDGGRGYDTFRSCFTNFLSVLGLVFQRSHFKVFIHSVGPEFIKTRCRVCSRVSKNKILCPLWVDFLTAVPLSGKKLSVRPLSP